MDIMPQFMAYAADFEQTFVDDDWTRLEKYFAADAVYEVQSGSFGCRLTGPAAILAGIKKSLDHFDRKFDKRDIQITSPPEVTGDEMRVGWAVLYTKAGWPPFTLRGRSTVRYAGTVIAHLCDSYDPSMDQELAAWRRESGATVDPSYT